MDPMEEEIIFTWCQRNNIISIMSIIPQAHCFSNAHMTDSRYWSSKKQVFIKRGTPLVRKIGVSIPCTNYPKEAILYTSNIMAVHIFPQSHGPHLESSDPV